ncbi:hypothetical protein PENTCL1PPCAC_30390, partial [Pristionchus entomophagus]
AMRRPLLSLLILLPYFVIGVEGYACQSWQVYGCDPCYGMPIIVNASDGSVNINFPTGIISVKGKGMTARAVCTGIPYEVNCRDGLDRSSHDSGCTRVNHHNDCGRRRSTRTTTRRRGRTASEATMDATPFDGTPASPHSANKSTSHECEMEREESSDSDSMTPRASPAPLQEEAPRTTPISSMSGGECRLPR